jgi:hypothetical protein
VDRQRQQNAEVETIWEGIDALMTEADASDDPTIVRSLLAQANGLIDDLLRIRPDDPDAASTRETILQRIEESSHVRRVRWESELLSYSGDVQLTRVVVEGVHVFVMDRRANVVYHHQLDDFRQTLLPGTEETVLVHKGQQIGGILVADLVDMTWMPVGNGRQQPALVILETGGAAIEYDPGTGALTAHRVAAWETWVYPSRIGSHTGRLYVLDSRDGQILRYAPREGGYTKMPDEWLKSEVDLVGVADMAIGDSIYLAYANGQLRKLTNGRPAEFDVSDWDVGPGRVSALYTRPPEEMKWLYIADPDNGRIVQCGRDGAFNRQYRMADSETAEVGDPLAAISNLFVDETEPDGPRAYFLSENRLHMIILPDASE